MAVFEFEILGSPEEACDVAREAFEGAISELANVREEDYKDVSMII